MPGQPAAPALPFSHRAQPSHYTPDPHPPLPSIPHPPPPPPSAKGGTCAGGERTGSAAAAACLAARGWEMLSERGDRGADRGAGGAAIPPRHRTPPPHRPWPPPLPPAPAALSVTDCRGTALPLAPSVGMGAPSRSHLLHAVQRNQLGKTDPPLFPTLPHPPPHPPPVFLSDLYTS